MTSEEAWNMWRFPDWERENLEPYKNQVYHEEGERLFIVCHTAGICRSLK